MNDHVITKHIFLKATPKQVWEYLTEPDKLGLWFHAPKAPLSQGAAYSMCGADSQTPMIWGHVSKMQPYEILQYSFVIAPMGDAESQVKWTLQNVAGGTRLSLEHSGLPEGAAGFDLVLALDKGWDEHLNRLRTDIHE